MKKVISLLLAVVLVLGLSVSAMAAELKSDQFDVGASYTEGSVQIVGPDGSATTATVYSVGLSWTAIGSVTYKGSTESYYWDATALKYVKHDDTSVDAAWTKDEASCTITVTNRSNAAVKATATFNPAADTGATINCSFTNNGQTIASAAPTQAQLEAGTTGGSEKSGTIDVNVEATGALKDGVTSVGSISITIESVS